MHCFFLERLESILLISDKAAASVQGKTFR